MSLIKVISGGQTGVDQAALFAAKAAGLETGGWAPGGWRTAAGVDFRLRDEWGLREHASELYPPRTAANVRDSDATLRLAVDFSMPGERCTRKAIQRFGRPYLDVPLIESFEWSKLALNWLVENKVRTLNVAGNRERTNGFHVYDLAVIFLLPLFQAAKERR
jgi:Circularly permutated YpsA SLOG family